MDAAWLSSHGMSSTTSICNLVALATYLARAPNMRSMLGAMQLANRIAPDIGRATRRRLVANHRTSGTLGRMAPIGAKLTERLAGD